MQVSCKETFWPVTNYLWPGTYLTLHRWAHNSNLLKNICCSYVKSSDTIIASFCRCHDSWAIITCTKLWPQYMISIKIKLKKIQDFKHQLMKYLRDGSQLHQEHDMKPNISIHIGCAHLPSEITCHYYYIGFSLIHGYFIWHHIWYRSSATYKDIKH